MNRESVPFIGCLAVGWLFATNVVNSPRSDAAEVTAVGRVTPRILSIEIHEGRVRLGPMRSYDRRDGDRVRGDGSKRRLVRGGSAVGFLVGDVDRGTAHVRFDDGFEGPKLDAVALSDPKTWSVSIDGRSLSPTAVHRRTSVADVSDINGGPAEVAFDHRCFLAFDDDLKDGSVEVVCNAPAAVRWTGQLKRTTTSPAVHVSLLGYETDQVPKRAVVGCWMGDGGAIDYRQAFDELPRFAVVNRDGEAVHGGRLTLRREVDQPSDHRGLRTLPDGSEINTAGTPTFEARFDEVTTAGRYRVLVEGVGASREFDIRDGVYRTLLDAAMESLRHHRWGVDDELRLSDGTTLPRPAAVPRWHGEGGVDVIRTAADYRNGNFDEFAEKAIGPWRPDAGGSPAAAGSVVGGYMDAGDYDRNYSHHVVGYLLSDLAMRVGESDRALAEQLIDAARWNVDLWVRMIGDDGGVPSAVEYAEHPIRPEPSWLNSQPLYVCAPSTASNEEFIAGTARTAMAMNELGIEPEAAAEYLRACRSAHRWLSPVDGTGGDGGAIDRRMKTLAELHAATGDGSVAAELRRVVERRLEKDWMIVQPDGMTALATMLESDDPASLLGKELAARAENVLRHSIELAYLEGGYRRCPYGSLKHGWMGVSYGGATFPDKDTCVLLRVAELLDAPEMARAVASGIAYAAGCNPNDRVYMTGVHPRGVAHALHCDARYAGVASPVGIPVYGPADPRSGSAWPLNWPLTKDRTVYPDYQTWPTLENLQGYWAWAEMMEYTVHQSHAPVIYAAGMLGR